MRGEIRILRDDAEDRPEDELIHEHLEKLPVAKGAARVVQHGEKRERVRHAAEVACVAGRDDDLLEKQRRFDLLRLGANDDQLPAGVAECQIEWHQYFHGDAAQICRDRLIRNDHRRLHESAAVDDVQSATL